MSFFRRSIEHLEDPLGELGQSLQHLVDKVLKMRVKVDHRKGGNPIANQVDVEGDDEMDAALDQIG